MVEGSWVARGDGRELGGEGWWKGVGWRGVVEGSWVARGGGRELGGEGWWKGVGWRGVMKVVERGLGEVCRRELGSEGCVEKGGGRVSEV